MNIDNYAYFQVSIKALVKKGEELLLLITPDNYYDFPGGRLNKDETNLDLIDILKREISEELGPDFKYQIKDIAFISKRKFNLNQEQKDVLAIFYEIEYVSGDIKLSDEHDKHKWIKPQEIISNPENFVSADEYNLYKKHFN